MVNYSEALTTVAFIGCYVSSSGLSLCPWASLSLLI